MKKPKKPQKVSKSSKKELTRAFYRIERQDGGFVLYRVRINSSGQVTSSEQGVADVLSNVFYQLKRAIKDEHGL